jgi:hypothetical protein
MVKLFTGLFIASFATTYSVIAYNAMLDSRLQIGYHAGYNAAKVAVPQELLDEGWTISRGEDTIKFFTYAD